MMVDQHWPTPPWKNRNKLILGEKVRAPQQYLVPSRRSPAPKLTPGGWKLFSQLFRKAQDQLHDTAVSKGWWLDRFNHGEKIALMHSELSEALEALREGDQPSKKIGPFSCVEEELADVVIRVMDYAAYLGLNLIGAIRAKMAYNETRSFKHGGKKF